MAAAARYFRFPSTFFAGNGPPIQLRTFVQVETALAELPCGATFLSARRYGPYVNVLFRLTNRPGPGGGVLGAAPLLRRAQRIKPRAKFGGGEPKWPEIMNFQVVPEFRGEGKPVVSGQQIRICIIFGLMPNF